MTTLPLRFKSTAMSLRKFLAGQNGHREVAIIKILVRFYCALVVSATIRVILTKILNRSGIPVHWNGGFTYYMANQGRHVLKIYLCIPPTNLEGNC